MRKIFKEPDEIRKELSRKEDRLWNFYSSVRHCRRDEDKRFTAATDFLYELQEADPKQYLETGYEVRLVPIQSFKRFIRKSCTHENLYDGKFCQVVLVENFRKEFMDIKEVPVEANPEEAFAGENFEEERIEWDPEEEKYALSMREELIVIYLAPDIK